MVDTYGRWTYFSDEPEDEWNELDRIAHWIEEKGYQSKTSMENLVVKLVLHFECDLESIAKDWPDNPEDLIGDIEIFVELSGGLSAFDYES